MEKMPLPDSTFDVVISNGAFCLAPNKEKAFKEVFRVSKPGGGNSLTLLVNLLLDYIITLFQQCYIHYCYIYINLVQGYTLLSKSWTFQ